MSCKKEVSKKCSKHCIEIARESSCSTFSLAGASGWCPRPRNPHPGPLPRGEGMSREEGTKNVQIASGCIKNWYELRVGVSRCYAEVLLRQRLAAMPLPVVDETRTSQSCIKNGAFVR